jgi:thiol-disulfide isomerase/thioredoxin
VKLSKLAKGKYVVIDFWASWCSDCRKDIPNIKRLYERFHPLGVEFVGVSFDDNADNCQAAASLGITTYQNHHINDWLHEDSLF